MNANAARTESPSWWVNLPRVDFSREAARRMAAMSARESARTLNLHLTRKPKPEGNRASIRRDQ